MNWIKENIISVIIAVVVGVGLGYFVEACCEQDGKEIIVDETLTTTVENELKHVFFDAVVVHPLHIVVHAALSLHCSFFDVVAKNIFKNIQRQQVSRKNKLIKSALKEIVYDANSSHLHYSCRYHVLVLRELII
jgi:hypothetical protein